MPRYAASSYDDYLCLRPPLLLWVAVLYFARAIVLPIAMGLGPLMRINRDTLQLLQGLWSLQTLFPSLIAAALLYAMIRRLPTASMAVRWIWAHGRLLLTMAAAVDLALLAISLVQRGGLEDDQALTSLVTVVLDLYFVLYILASRRVRDTFADFPGGGPAH